VDDDSRDKSDEDEKGEEAKVKPGVVWGPWDGEFMAAAGFVMVVGWPDHDAWISFHWKGGLEETQGSLTKIRIPL
jgi:hypothetical protein